MRPRVSIGLPVFNGEHYIEETLQSILGQTFGDLEVVISDTHATIGFDPALRAPARRHTSVR